MAKKDKDYGNDELVQYYTKAYEALEKETQNDTYGSYVLSRVKGGQKTVFNKTQSEIRNFDMSFLDNIESVYPAITKIMRDPKKSLRYEQEIVGVEKARKTNSDTVRHLSSHTHLIKEITKAGDVIPSKVLTTYAEEELAIYENRFLKSLVRRMEMFLERRYEVMKVSLESFETERLSVQNEFLMSGQTVQISLDVAIKSDLTTNVETTKEQYDRLLHIREMVQALKGTDFMRALAKARDVLPPIMKTNILMHNPDFKLCYALWLYLDRVDGIATNIDIKEKSYKYSANFDKDINDVMTLALAAFIKNRNIDGIYSSRKVNTVKAPKPIENESLQLEMNLEADNNKLEDYTMNQIMLDQTAQFFEASMDGLQKIGNTYNESVKVVYRQMLDMVDQLYPKAFGISDDEFESADLYKQLEYARRQMMVAKIVKQQKQMALAKMGREEKRIEKLISKLEEKIKKQEAKERERLEKEAARIEAQRQAALERERVKEAKRKAYEKLAVDKAKEIERKIADRKKAMEQANLAKLEQQARIKPHAEAKRNHLKELREKERGKWDNPMEQQIPVVEEAPVMPIRRRDDFDDLSDEELAELLSQNEILDAIPEKKEEEKPKKKVVVAKKKEEPKKEEPKPKKKESEELEDLSDDDLADLLGVNFGSGDFNAADLADDEEVTPKAKTISKKSKEEYEAEKKAKAEKEAKLAAEEKAKKEAEAKAKADAEAKAEADRKQAAMDALNDIEEPVVEEKPKKKSKKKEEPIPEPVLDDIPEPDLELDDEFDSFMNNLEEKEETPVKDEESVQEEPIAEPVVEEEAVEDTEIPEPDLALDDEFDDFLNSIPEKEEAPAKEEEKKPSPKPAKPAEERDPFADIVKNKKIDNEDDGDDDFDNLSDDELEALMAANDMDF